MHGAYTCSAILEKLPVRVESLAAWGSCLLLGTDAGALLVYEVVKRVGSDDFDVRVLDSIKGFGRKAITQLTVLARSNLILSLSDGCVSVHDIGVQNKLPVISLRTQLKPRSAHLFSVDASTPESRLCVAAKKKLHFFRLAPGSKEFEEVCERTGPDAARALAWAGAGRICVGYKREYTLLDVATGAVQELFETGKTGAPLATVMPHGQLLLNKDNISIFLGFDGKPTRKHGINWNECPIDFGYAFPYVIGLLPSGVELRTLTSPNTQMIRACKGARSLACGEDQIYCASGATVWRLEPVPIAEQVTQLVADNEFSEALNLLDCLPDSVEKAEQKRNINIQYAFHLFHLGQHDTALDKFQTLKEDPLRVLGLYPRLLPDTLAGRWRYPFGTPTLAGPVLDSAMRALAGYLQRVRLDRLAGIAPAGIAPAGVAPAGIAPAGVTAAGVTAAAAAPLLVPDDFNACADLPAVVLDTALLRALLKSDHPFLPELVAGANACHIPTSENALLAARRYRELVALYRVRGLHTKALELLHKLGREASTGDMFGVGPTVAYLQQLGNADLPLLLEYSPWVFREDADLGLAIFTAPRPPAQALNAAVVLKHLDKHAPGAVADYLEHVINVVRETDPAFHNELIFTYLRSIQVILRNPASSARPPQKAAAEVGLLGVIRKKLLRFLEQSPHYKAEKMLSRFPTQDLYEERALLLSRIGRHDQALAIYAHRLEDAAMAETYCDRHFVDAPDVYLTLLEVYLKAPVPMVAPALALLNRHHDRMDAARALKLLPADLSVAQLAPFLTSVIAANESQLRDHRLERSLLKGETRAVREQWHRARARRINISEDQLCPVCNRRIGKDVMFVAYPDGRILHYVCDRAGAAKDSSQKENSNIKK